MNGTVKAQRQDGSCRDRYLKDLSMKTFASSVEWRAINWTQQLKVCWCLLGEAAWMLFSFSKSKNYFMAPSFFPLDRFSLKLPPGIDWTSKFKMRYRNLSNGRSFMLTSGLDLFAIFACELLLLRFFYYLPDKFEFSSKESRQNHLDSAVLEEMEFSVDFSLWHLTQQ